MEDSLPGQKVSAHEDQIPDQIFTRQDILMKINSLCDDESFGFLINGAIRKRYNDGKRITHIARDVQAIMTQELGFIDMPKRSVEYCIKKMFNRIKNWSANLITHSKIVMDFILSPFTEIYLELHPRVKINPTLCPGYDMTRTGAQDCSCQATYVDTTHRSTSTTIIATTSSDIVRSTRSDTAPLNSGQLALKMLRAENAFYKKQNGLMREYIDELESLNSVRSG